MTTARVSGTGQVKNREDRPQICLSHSDQPNPWKKSIDLSQIAGFSTILKARIAPARGAMAWKEFIPVKYLVELSTLGVISCSLGYCRLRSQLAVNTAMEKFWIDFLHLMDIGGQ